MNTNNTDLKSWQEAEALKRFSLISPLLQEDLDGGAEQHFCPYAVPV